MTERFWRRVLPGDKTIEAKQMNQPREEDNEPSELVGSDEGF